MPPVTPPKPIVKKKPDTDALGLVKKTLPWVLIVLGLGGIYLMIHFNPPEKRMNCRAAPGGTGLTGFGSCTTD